MQQRRLVEDPRDQVGILAGLLTIIVCGLLVWLHDNVTAWVIVLWIPCILCIDAFIMWMYRRKLHDLYAWVMASLMLVIGNVLGWGFVAVFVLFNNIPRVLGG